MLRIASSTAVATTACATHLIGNVAARAALARACARARSATLRRSMTSRSARTDLRRDARRSAASRWAELASGALGVEVGALSDQIATAGTTAVIMERLCRVRPIRPRVRVCACVRVCLCVCLSSWFFAQPVRPIPLHRRAPPPLASGAACRRCRRYRRCRRERRQWCVSGAAIVLATSLDRAQRPCCRHCRR